MALIDRMLAKRGKSKLDLHPSSNIAKRMKAQGVPHTPELERIVALPEHDWIEDEISFLQDELTEWLKAPEGKQRLKPAQVMLLSTLYDLEGLVGVVPVGGGKTIFTFLAPTVVGAKRPLLLVPGPLREKTVREFEEIEEHWAKHPDYMVMTYQKLSRESGRDLLFEREPDLVVCDEIHKLKDPATAVSHHMSYYLEDYPQTIFCGVSGTVTNRSLMEYHHLLKWALGHLQMPLPEKVSETQLWARALDEKLRGASRIGPGALRVFVPGAGEGRIVSRKEARQGFQNRLRTTPGVVVMDASEVDASIVGSYWEPEIPEAVQKHLDHLNDEWETPSGDVCKEPVDVWRHARELVCGFYYRWDPQAPEDWLDARKKWFRFVREQLSLDIGLPSPLQIAKACESGFLNSGQRYERWRDIRGKFKPNNVPIWVDTSVLQQVLDRQTTQPTLIWVEHVAVGEKLAEISGLPFFSREGKDKKGRFIESIKGKETVVVSIPSNLEGRNLQAWSRNSIVSPPPNGALLEQVFGRTHREGQEADDVYFEIALGNRAIRDGMRQAIRDAKYTQETMGTPQKLLLAKLDLLLATHHQRQRQQTTESNSHG